jgi:putative hydrolase of the HAD superfamily
VVRYLKRQEVDALVRAILFDLDETLILDEPVTRAALAEAAALAGPGVDQARLAERAWSEARRLWAEGPYAAYCERIGHSAAEGLWARYDRGEHPAIAGLRAWAPGYRTAAWQAALAAQGIRDDDLARSMAGRFAAARRRYPRYPEVDPLLAALRARGLRLGIVTNGVPDLQRTKLAGSGLEEAFDAVVISGEIDCGKPDPGIFHHILGEMGVPPAEAVMVGDNPGRDVAGGRAAGLRTVWVQRNGRARDPRHPADLECTDLSAILPWLDGLA